jgi:hypothetical protein
VQASDHFGSIQARSEPVDRRKIATLDKTIAALDHLKVLASGLALDPLVAIQDHLGPEGRIAAHADGHVAPVRIHQMKVVVLDEWPLLAMAYFDDPAVSSARDFPYRRSRAGGDHQKQAAELRIGGQVRRSQFVFALTSLRFDDLDLALATRAGAGV